MYKYTIKDANEKVIASSGDTYLSLEDVTKQIHYQVPGFKTFEPGNHSFGSYTIDIISQDVDFTEEVDSSQEPPEKPPTTGEKTTTSKTTSKTTAKTTTKS